MPSSQRQVPETPRVISPTPTPSESGSVNNDDYFAPTTRSSTRKKRSTASAKDTTPVTDPADPEIRARSRSRGADVERRRRLSGLTATATTSQATPSNAKATRRKPLSSSTPTTITPTATTTQPASSLATTTTTNGHLSPDSAAKASGLGLGSSYWRSLSRSPSPLGLIPIHRSWRTFVHRHEIPRKALHVSIGFVTLYLYGHGVETSAIHPVLLRLLIPIAAVDVARHNIPSFNATYIRVLGAFMRESEAHDRYNGVIWYLAGAWAVLRVCPKDVAVMSILLLSWCDTAASTFGRLWGRYTPRIRRGKSLAGSLAALTVGVVTAVTFWGVIAPMCRMNGWATDQGVNAFAFQGVLEWPGKPQWRLAGNAALGVMSAVAGFVASASEAVDLFGWDDNVTIPVLCGVGLWGFLRAFGSG